MASPPMHGPFLPHSQDTFTDDPTWVEIAYTGNILEEPSVPLAELTAACEACETALAFVRGSLQVDAATARVLRG